MTSVLVVDDEDIVRVVAVAMFEEIGFRAFEASSGQEALEVLKRQPDVALLFTDCRMPGMSGPELARAAIQQYPSLKVVLVSGYPDVRDHEPWPLLLKPYEEADLKRVVDTAIRN